METAENYVHNLARLGSYDGSLFARDGKTLMEDMDAFGQEWQVKAGEEPMLFRATREPQFPTKCMLPSPKAAGQRRLGETIAKDAAEKACNHLTGTNFENCVFDVMAMGDIEIASTHAA